MISVEEASSILHTKLLKTSIGIVPITEATGKILGEVISVDRDLPPFNRATMDGVAVAFQSLGKQNEFAIESIQAAGEPQKKLTSEKNAIEIMTGAVLPEEADTIIPYEQISITNGMATLKNGPDIQQGQNIHQQGADAVKGQIILQAGIKLSPAEIAVLASVGKSHVLVYQFPSIAIVSTGNELVDISETPLPHQLRKSNSYALQASLREMGCQAALFHLPDDQSILEKELKQIVNQHQVVILSGGVSKGKFDFVPQVLESIGIQKHFHQVAQKPGKPFWFGSHANRFVFGLPGNPVSTYLCFYRYIKPWLYRSLGYSPSSESAILATDYIFKP
ncbi:MAG: molybdopterin molybdotransferase MoeA, partial [Flammeovirgaceae bacterium]